MGARKRLDHSIQINALDHELRGNHAAVLPIPEAGVLVYSRLNPPLANAMLNAMHDELQSSVQ